MGRLAYAEQAAAARPLIRAQKPLTIPQSIGTLVEGFRTGFQARDHRSSLSGMSFFRIAGQATNLSDENSRSEILRVLNLIKPGGAFIVLGHGGLIPCGAVAAKKKSMSFARRGKEFSAPDSVRLLVDHVSPKVRGLASPFAELENSQAQAFAILRDPELAKIIKKKNLTVVAAVCSLSKQNGVGNGVTLVSPDLPAPIHSAKVYFLPINRGREWKVNLATLKAAVRDCEAGRTDTDNVREKSRVERELFIRHQKLFALREQLVNGLHKIVHDKIDLSKQYAHALFVFDQLLMRSVLDPLEQYLDVGGISCMDARLAPNTPDGPKQLFRIPPNHSASVNVEMNGEVKFSYDDIGSMEYAYGHIAGVNSLSPNDPGNGHTIILDTSATFAHAQVIREALIGEQLVAQATDGGKTITLVSFTGTELLIRNPGFKIDLRIPYRPEYDLFRV
ncbi:hypothetical protein HY988_06980 [Candidatus Micrarchaeota archaeon]|nr:hypothetical protein [Candidatus Micrarchaeota archaeon]